MKEELLPLSSIKGNKRFPERGRREDRKFKSGYGAQLLLSASGTSRRMMHRRIKGVVKTESTLKLQRGCKLTPKKGGE
jgi:hypothetical protein